MENPGYHHLHTPAPDPRTIKQELPEELAKIVLRCLEKKPDARFQSADDILTALSKVPEEGEPTLHIQSTKGGKSSKRKEGSTS
jgi:serine/threonine protein kinase